MAIWIDHSLAGIGRFGAYRGFNGVGGKSRWKTQVAGSQNIPHEIGVMVTGNGIDGHGPELPGQIR